MKGLAKFTTVEFIKERYHIQDVEDIKANLIQPYWETYGNTGNLIKSLRKPYRIVNLWFTAFVENTSSKKCFEAVRKDTGRNQELKAVLSAFGLLGKVTKFKVEVHFKVENGKVKE